MVTEAERRIDQLKDDINALRRDIEDAQISEMRFIDAAAGAAAQQTRAKRKIDADLDEIQALLDGLPLPRTGE